MATSDSDRLQQRLAKLSPDERAALARLLRERSGGVAPEAATHVVGEDLGRQVVRQREQAHGEGRGSAQPQTHHDQDGQAQPVRARSSRVAGAAAPRSASSA